LPFASCLLPILTKKLILSYLLMITLVTIFFTALLAVTDFTYQVLIHFFTALLAVTDFTYQVLIHFPIQIINFLGSLLSYGVIGLIIFVLVWIVGD